ncbi:MAG: type IV pilus assembly protein PilM [Planctomycetes bacterium]|nr:type IV pilus assembly protein PilM [Planctomycetota bacterium]
MFRRGKSVVGLDLGSQVVKAVEITLEGPEPVVTGFARIEIPPGGDKAQALAELFKRGRFRAKQVVTSVAGQSVVVRYVQMPKMSESELRQAIKVEADRYVPFELDECVMDCQPLRRHGTKSGEGDAKQAKDDNMTVLLVACRQQMIDEQIKLVQAHNLQPLAIDVDAFALANAWELCGLPDEDAVDEPAASADGSAKPKEEKAIALVDIGASRTSINVLAGGETCFSREIGIGGHDMTQAVARKLGLEVFEAEAIKRAGDDKEADVARSIQPVLEDLTNEISLSLDYVENHEGLRVEEVLLSGGGALAPGVIAYVEQATGRTARTWNPLEGLRVADDRVDVEELESWAPSLVVALGLASRVRAA